MELTGLKCNRCGARIFDEDEGVAFWAKIVIAIEQIQHKQVLHFCPECFNAFSKGLEQYDNDELHINRELEASLNENS